MHLSCVANTSRHMKYVNMACVQAYSFNRCILIHLSNDPKRFLFSVLTRELERTQIQLWINIRGAYNNIYLLFQGIQLICIERAWSCLFAFPLFEKCFFISALFVRCLFATQRQLFYHMHTLNTLRLDRKKKQAMARNIKHMCDSGKGSGS